MLPLTTLQNQVIGVKSKSTREALDHAPDQHRGQSPYKKQMLPILSLSPLQSYDQLNTSLH